MTRKRVVETPQARRDVEQAVDYYSREGGVKVALDFIEALHEAYGAIGEFPRASSQRWAGLLDLPGLRHRSLARFPFAAFYVELADKIEVWRVLHTRRDLPVSLVEIE